MTKYTDQLYAHLSSYKQQCLRIKEGGTFRHKGRDILPKNQKWLNILEPYREEIRAYLNNHSEITLVRELEKVTGRVRSGSDLMC